MMGPGFGEAVGGLLAKQLFFLAVCIALVAFAVGALVGWVF